MKIEGNIPLVVKTSTYNRLNSYKRLQKDKSFNETIWKMLEVYDKSGAT